MGPFSAVIFDFDGTLVDTMPLHYEAYRRVFAELGLSLDEDAFYASIGGTAREVIPRLVAGRPVAADVPAIHARKKAVLEHLLGEAEIPVLATASLLPLLRPAYRVGLASSGARPGIDAMLDRLGWRGWFDAIVTGEDVPRGKPAPDPFLAAASRLGVAPAACFVFEDTDDGVASARAAGMAVFDVREAPARRLRRGAA